MHFPVDLPSNRIKTQEDMLEIGTRTSQLNFTTQEKAHNYFLRQMQLQGQLCICFLLYTHKLEQNTHSASFLPTRVLALTKPSVSSVF